MKLSKALIIALAASLLVFGLSGAAFAFHEGGVAACEGCHTMHNSGSNVVNYPDRNNTWNGAPGIGTIFGGTITPTALDGSSLTQGTAANNYLTRGTDPSSTCMNCHAEGYSDLGGESLSYQDSGDQKVVTIPDGATTDAANNAGANEVVPHNTPGGDFFWLTETYTYGGSTSNGGNHGHVIQARNFTSFASISASLTAAPGAPSDETYMQSNLACNSCHNPHGRVNGGTRNGNLPVIGSGSYGGLIAELGLSSRVGNANNTPTESSHSGSTPTVNNVNEFTANGLSVPAGTIVGNYRLLADTFYSPGDTSVGYGGQETASGFPANNYTYRFPAPVAWAPQDNGATDFPSASYASNDWNVHSATTAPADPGAEAYNDIQHVDYIYGMSEWCANCHYKFLNDGTYGAGDSTSHRHPAGDGAVMDNVYTMYNAYSGTGSYASTDSVPQATNTIGAYWAMVPFERSSAAVSGDNSADIYGPYDTHGPDSFSNVMCLTCHRAHASPFDYDTRWDTLATFISGSSIFTAIDQNDGTPADNQLAYAIATTAPYWGRTWSTAHTDAGGGTTPYGDATGNQRSLCNKCHVQD